MTDMPPQDASDTSDLGAPPPSTANDGPPGEGTVAGEMHRAVADDDSGSADPMPDIAGTSS